MTWYNEGGIVPSGVTVFNSAEGEPVTPAGEYRSNLERRITVCRARVFEAQTAYNHCPSTQRYAELEEAWEMLDEWIDKLPRTAV